MRKRLNQLILPALIAIIFIVSTAIVSQSMLSLTPFGRFCFAFHAVPFGIGFSGNDEWLMWLYYLVLWFVLTALVFGLIKIIRMFKPEAE